MKRVKEVEQSVLATFQEEIPSVYYSDKGEKEFEEYRANATFTYRSLFKFPPKMFADCDLIDFGAGTGENTVYLANWGARCTLVEMNHLAQAVSKDVFRKYTNNFDEHRFVLSSIFDYEDVGVYDIVHCRGVLSHTDDKEGAFAKIAKHVKPGGYLIFGDPNKAGGFQNMLQRYIIYRFGKTTDEMVDLSERLFKEDIDRSQRFVNRTRRTIIFDRWVVQKQNDPSVSEVLQWLEECGLELYSSYPPIVFPYLSDSVHHTPKFDVRAFKEVAVLTEAAWMSYRDHDSTEIPRLLQSLSELGGAQAALTGYVADCSSDTVIEGSELVRRVDDYLASIDDLDVTSGLATRVKGLMVEVKELFEVMENDDIDEVEAFLGRTRYLFRGAVGVRHVDFIAYRSE